MDFSAQLTCARRILQDFDVKLHDSVDDLPTDVERSVKYICDNCFDESLSVASMLNELNIKTNTIYSKFKYHCHATPGKLIEIWRVEAAKHILDRSKVDIAAVAFAVGYNNERTFERVFKKTVGVSASRYRNGAMPWHK